MYEMILRTENLDFFAGPDVCSVDDRLTCVFSIVCVSVEILLSLDFAVYDLGLENC